MSLWDCDSYKLYLSISVCVSVCVSRLYGLYLSTGQDIVWFRTYTLSRYSSFTYSCQKNKLNECLISLWNRFQVITSFYQPHKCLLIGLAVEFQCNTFFEYFFYRPFSGGSHIFAGVSFYTKFYYHHCHQNKKKYWQWIEWLLFFYSKS